jgi:hypothetical protein
MKGQVSLEYPFKMLIYTVVFLVVVGLVVIFREQIVNGLKICQLLPYICKEQNQCSTIEVRQATISETIMKNYCNSCWEKTGKKDSTKDCLCYIVKGIYYPIGFQQENCELKCDKETDTLLFMYDGIRKKVYINC